MIGTNEDKKLEIRKMVVLQASKLIGIPYQKGYEWVDYTKPPEFADCSEMIEGCFKISGLIIPDGSQNQFRYTVPVEKGKQQMGDLAFFGKNKSIHDVYHVGIVFDNKNIIEAREFDGRDWTGKVCLREFQYWENWKNFLGYRSHPKLI